MFPWLDPMTGAAMPPPGYGGPASFLPPNLFAGPGFSNPGAMDASLAGAPYQAPGSTAASIGGNVANAPGGGIGSDYAASGGQDNEGAAPFAKPGSPASLPGLGGTQSALMGALRGIQ